jgi:hypothetical protein
MPERSFRSISLNRHSRQQRAKARAFRRLLMWAALALFWAGAASAPALAQTLGPPVYAGGHAVATITVTFTAAPPAGSTISCSLSLISNDPRNPSDTNSISAPVTGSTAVCNITMYYYWRLTSGSNDTMTIAYSVQGPAQTSNGIVGVIAMPANGAEVGPMHINVTQ